MFPEWCVEEEYAFFINGDGSRSAREGARCHKLLSFTISNKIRERLWTWSCDRSEKLRLNLDGERFLNCVSWDITCCPWKIVPEEWSDAHRIVRRQEWHRTSSRSPDDARTQRPYAYDALIYCWHRPVGGDGREAQGRSGRLGWDAAGKTTAYDDLRLWKSVKPINNSINRENLSLLWLIFWIFLFEVLWWPIVCLIYI